MLVASASVILKTQKVKPVMQVHLVSQDRMVTRGQMDDQVHRAQMEIQDERVHQDRRETKVLLVSMETMVQMEKRVDLDVTAIPDDLGKWVHQDLPDQTDRHLLVIQEMMDEEVTMVIQDVKVTLDVMVNLDVMAATVRLVMQVNVETMAKTEDQVKTVSQEEIAMEKSGNLDQLVTEVPQVNQD